MNTEHFSLNHYLNAIFVEYASGQLNVVVTMAVRCMCVSASVIIRVRPEMLVRAIRVISCMEGFLNYTNVHPEVTVCRPQDQDSQLKGQDHSR